MERNLTSLNKFKPTKDNLDYHYADEKLERRSGYVRSIYEVGTYRHNLNTKQ